MPAPDSSAPPRSACDHARAGCAGAALCRFAPREEQKPHPEHLPRGGRLALVPAAERWCFHAVRSGLVGVAVRVPGGRRQILCLTGPGELVCPGAPGGPETRLEALAPTDLCRIDLSAGVERLRRNPAFREQIGALTGLGLAHGYERIVALGTLDGPARLAAFLAEMAGRMGERRETGLHLSLAMTREDIADYLGLNADTVSRLLNRLRRAGFVRFLSPTSMEIPDLRSLAAAGSGHPQARA